VSGPALVWAALASTVLEPFSPSSAYGAPALVGSLAVCAIYYASRRRARGRRLSVSGFVRSIFPRRILLHPSSRLDMRLWALNGIAFTSAYGMLGLGLFFWRDQVVAGLTHGWGTHAPVREPAWAILSLATVLQILASELAYWFAHYCFHKVPALWEFHKVHHSAEVMTTLTELRQHPVEIIAFMNLIGLSTGIVFGAMTYAFGPGVRPFTLLNGNILLMTFLATYGHLRHSHMWIAFTGFAGRILQSPAHHQLHHSANPVHYDRNLGFALAVFDWAFGTLAIPARAREPIVFGLGAGAAPIRSALAAFVIPCARSSGHISRFAQRFAAARSIVDAAQGIVGLARRRTGVSHERPNVAAFLVMDAPKDGRSSNRSAQ
jgi:sterol desaturase/sphingolipid hydroxylase (fatty acid hydroxylase superfamily)